VVVVVGRKDGLMVEEVRWERMEVRRRGARARGVVREIVDAMVSECGLKVQ
jgi:hypothetical protein